MPCSTARGVAYATCVYDTGTGIPTTGVGSNRFIRRMYTTNRNEGEEVMATSKDKYFPLALWIDRRHTMWQENTCPSTSPEREIQRNKWENKTLWEITKNIDPREKWEIEREAHGFRYSRSLSNCDDLGEIFNWDIRKIGTLDEILKEGKSPCQGCLQSDQPLTEFYYGAVADMSGKAIRLDWIKYLCDDCATDYLYVANFLELKAKIQHMRDLWDNHRQWLDQFEVALKVWRDDVELMLPRHDPRYQEYVRMYCQIHKKELDKENYEHVIRFYQLPEDSFA